MDASFKRNSGRTGRRRMTAAEAALGGQHAVADHRRRYGEFSLASALPPLPEPPAWFNPEMIEIWQSILAAAPPGLLVALDHDNLVVYCVAVSTHRGLARKAAATKTTLAPALERRLRLAAAEVGRAAKVLGLPTYDRTRIAVPPLRELPSSEHELFDLILPTGERIPYGGRCSD